MYLNFIEPPKTVDMNSKHGDKIVYLFPKNGSQYDQEECKRLLEYKMIYTVDAVDIGNYITYVKLKELGDEWFNAVMFDNYNPKLYSPNDEHEKDVLQEYIDKITEMKEKADMYDNLCK